MSEELQVDKIIVFGFKVTENVNEKNIEIISKKIIPIYEKILNLFEKRKLHYLLKMSGIIYELLSNYSGCFQKH